MGKTSEIQWTDATWNIARGCRKVDEDCKFCYMYRDSMGEKRYNPREVVRTKTVFDMPVRLKQVWSNCREFSPTLIFTSSLTDFFLPEIDDYRHEAWEIIRRTDHIYQILTKRPERIEECLPDFYDEIKDRVWLGTSVGSMAGAHRIKELDRVVTTSKKFLSLEPLHGQIDFYELLDQNDGLFVDWVIVGGESGHETGKYRYRPCELEWIEKIVDFCKMIGTPVFVKQMGTHLAKQLNMSDRHGGNIEEFPEHLRIRQFPA